jgi:hypothetical protein
MGYYSPRKKENIGVGIHVQVVLSNTLTLHLWERINKEWREFRNASY